MESRRRPTEHYNGTAGPVVTTDPPHTHTYASGLTHVQIQHRRTRRRGRDESRVDPRIDEDSGSVSSLCVSETPLTSHGSLLHPPSSLPSTTRGTSRPRYQRLDMVETHVSRQEKWVESQHPPLLHTGPDSGDTGG